MFIDLEPLKKKANIPAMIGARVDMRQQGEAYVACCPFHEESTPSWHLDKRQGEWLWKCFGCGLGGDIITFIEKIDGLSTADAINKFVELADRQVNKQWVDGARQTQDVFKPLADGGKKKPKTTYTIAQWMAYENELSRHPEAYEWLLTVRGITAETASLMHLGFKQTHNFRIKEEFEHVRNMGWILFPRIDGEGDKAKVVAVKFRSIVGKAFTQLENMDSRALFNIETVNPTEPVYVTEGELDACVLEQAGFRAVSCPSAGVDISTESKIKLKLAERVFLAGDNDGGVGVEYMKKLARELGENTHMLPWPDGKDANDFFRDACKRNVETFRTQVLALSKKAKNAPPEGFHALRDRLLESEGTDLGGDIDRLHHPLESVDKMTYTPRGAVALIYSTYSGTGKSMYKSQLLLHEASRGEVVVDLSPEIRDDEYLALVVSQTVGPHVAGGLRRTSRIDRKYFEEAAKRLDVLTERGTEFRYYVGHNVLGQTEDEVLAFLENTIRTLGVTRFAIDTFHRLVMNNGKMNQVEAEGRMIKKLESLAIKYGTIFILICQSNAEAEGIDNLKKGEHGVLRGSREIRDIPASIYLLHRARRSQKDGENPDDILELKTGMFAKKTRYKGPGRPQVDLWLKEEFSLFRDMEVNRDDPQGPAPEMNEEFQ